MLTNKKLNIKYLKLKCPSNHPIQIQAVTSIIGISYEKVRHLSKGNLIPCDAWTNFRGELAVFAHALPLLKILDTFEHEVDDYKLQEFSKKFLKCSEENWNFDFNSHWWHDFSPINILDEIYGKYYDEIKAKFVETLNGLKQFIRAESKVLYNPNVRRGIPTLRGTRIGVFEAGPIANLNGIEVAQEHFPSLSEEDFEDAILYTAIYKNTCRVWKSKSI